MRTLIATVIACLLFTSCQKEINFDTPAVVNGACKACSYVPFCNGSVYVYSDTSGGIGVDVIDTIKILKDTTIDGKVFQKFSNPGGPAGYYNCNAGESTVLAFNVQSSGGLLARLEQTPLKANASVGATWTNTITVMPGQTIDYDFSIIAKGLSRTVLGVTYNDVIHVHQIISTTAPIIGTMVFGESDIYFANNIGIIENITYSDAILGPPTVIYHRVLKTYNIP